MKYTILLFVLLFSACQNTTENNSSLIPTTDEDVDITPPIEFTTDITAPIEKIKKGKITKEENKSNSSYNGSWFSVKYPRNFKAAPTEPTDTFTEDRFGEPIEPPYTFVRAEEATFTSPDGKVEFFIYSPLWGGEPESYLLTAANEKIISDTTKKDKDPSWGRTHRWVSFEDKNGKYKRAFHHMKTENTSLVFGIKYADQVSYDTYKEDYLAFKGSLMQFAD